MATSSESTVGKDIVNIDLANLCFCSLCQKHKIDQPAECYCKKCLKFYCAKCVIKHGKKFKKHVTYGTEDKKMWPFPEKELHDFLQKCGFHEDKHGNNLQSVEGSHYIDEEEEHLETFCNDRKCAEVSVQGDSDQVFSVQGISEYDVSLPSDSKNSLYFYAICVLSDDKILVADRSNNKVKLLNHQYQEVGHCDLNAYLRDMCKITPSEVAVIVNDCRTHAVQFVSVNGGRLVKGRKLQFIHPCHGIAYNLQHLYLTSGTALYKYSMSGDLLIKLYEDTSSWAAVYKCAVSPSGNKIFVTHFSHGNILTLSRDGTVLHRFTDPDLKFPCGIHVTDLGQVLVCGCGSETILQLDTEGKKKLATLATRSDGPFLPRSVCYNRSTASIIVGKLFSNTILVFKVK